MPVDQKGVGLVHILLAVLVIAVVGGGAYYLGTKNVSRVELKPDLVQVPSTTPIPSLSPSPSYFPTPSLVSSPIVNPTLLENVKAAVVSKNTAALEGYMLDTVNVIIEATECCGNLTKIKAISEMNYLNTATAPWNFEDNNPIAVALRQKNPTAFPVGAIIGTSANRMLVTFILNQDKTKIEKLYMAADYKLQGI